MKRLRDVVSTLSIMILLGLTVSASAQERVKHSGSIVSIADDAESLVLAEVGAWQVRNGATVITYRTITLTRETEFALVARADAAPSGFADDFVEIPVPRDGVYMNDYVTVDCRHEGKRLVALKITVTEVPAAADIGVGALR